MPVVAAISLFLFYFYLAKNTEVSGRLRLRLGWMKDLKGNEDCKQASHLRQSSAPYGLSSFCRLCLCARQYSVPPAVVAFTTQVPFLAALVGITYSIMSTSWDPEVSELAYKPQGGT